MSRGGVFYVEASVKPLVTSPTEVYDSGMRLWDKGGVTDAEMMRFTARDDWQLDQLLLSYDLRATRAHVRGLGRASVLSSDETSQLDAELEKLELELAAGEFKLLSTHEDGHTAIEEALIERLGDVGKKVHTGRSRNDQVLVATRLYLLDGLSALIGASTVAAETLLEMAKREIETPMPGYTHLQRAVPSSLGFWAASYAEGMLDARDTLRAAHALSNRSPLGGAAGYGVNLPLDRKGVSEDLGFAEVAVNPLWTQTSRGIIECTALNAAWQLSATIRRFAWDLSLFASSEFGFVTLDESLTTGSSIMPQKRNPDVVELLRASTSVIQGAVCELMTLTALPSGYQRDHQLTKAPMIRGMEEVKLAARLVVGLVAGTTWNRSVMAAAITPECFATDRAVELTHAGVPFREAYRQVAEEFKGKGAPSPGPEVASASGMKAAESLKKRISFGAPGNPGLADLERRLQKV